MASSRTGSWLRRLDGRLSSAWLRRLQRVARPAAQALRGQLIESNALCFDHNMKRLDGTLVGFVEQKKAEHPEKVLLVRVGEFYETWGVDAVMLVEFAGLNAMGAKAKAGTPWRNVQSTLDSLTSAGLTVAVYEELADGDTDAAARRIKTRASSEGLFGGVALPDRDDVAGSTPSKKVRAVAKTDEELMAIWIEKLEGEPDYQDLKNRIVRFKRAVHLSRLPANRPKHQPLENLISERLQAFLCETREMISNMERYYERGGGGDALAMNDRLLLESQLLEDFSSPALHTVSELSEVANQKCVRIYVYIRERKGRGIIYAPPAAAQLLDENTARTQRTCLKRQ